MWSVRMDMGSTACTSGSAAPVSGSVGLPRRIRSGNRKAARKLVCQAAATNSNSSWDQPNPQRDSLDEEWQRMRPLHRQLDAELDELWAAKTRGEAAELRSALDSLQDSAGDSEQLSFTSWGGEDGAPGSMSLSLDLEWPEHLQSRLSPSGNPMWQDLNQVFVILFGVGKAETEGIYSLRAMSRDDGLPQDTIIAFEHEDDAVRYAGLLEATMDHTPNVCPIEPAELVEFCTESGYTYRLESAGSLLIPPDYNVGMTDWERSIRLRGGMWQVSDNQPVSPTTATDPSYAARPTPMLTNNVGVHYYPADALEDMRARLERCLMPPPDMA